MFGPLGYLVYKGIISVDVLILCASFIVQCTTLKAKADERFSTGDPLGALALYEEALQTEPTFVSALSNRAACYLSMKELQLCIQDCDRALDILKIDLDNGIIGTNAGPGNPMTLGVIPPKGSAKRNDWVLRTTLRRAVAKLQAGDLSGAEKDFSLAADIDPENEGIKKDLQRVVAEQEKNRKIPVGE